VIRVGHVINTLSVGDKLSFLSYLNKIYTLLYYIYPLCTVMV
jgi:hypothetical protein